jgi:hypothetical protein
MLSRRTATMRDMRIAASFFIVSILQIVSPAAVVAVDSGVRRRTETVKGNSIFGRNRLAGDNHVAPQPTSTTNARPRRLHDGPIYHHGQVPNGVTLPEMEEGTIYHLSLEEASLGKKEGVKGGKGAREKPTYVPDDGDSEDATYPPESSDYSAPEKMQKAKGRTPSEHEAVTYPPEEEDSDSYDDADEEDHEETSKSVSYKKGYYPKKYPSDKLPSSSPKELPVAKAHTPKEPPVPPSRHGDPKGGALNDATGENESDLAIVSDGATATADAQDATYLGKLCLFQMYVGYLFMAFISQHFLVFVHIFQKQIQSFERFLLLRSTTPQTRQMLQV